MRIANHGVTKAVVILNHRVVFDEDDFTIKKHHQEIPVPSLSRRVAIQAGRNVLEVEIRGKHGTSFTLEITADNVADTTPPTITAVAAPPANANGWNNTTVNVSFTCADSGSGIATCPATVVATTEGANQVVSGTAIDKAGNKAAASVTLNIDKTAPAVTATAAPPSNADGWNREPVVVTFAATDALSGVAPDTLTAPITLSIDGSNLSTSGQATDRAGNTGTATLGGIKIDRLNPTIGATLTPVPNADGIVAGPVTVHFTCDDAGSGIVSCPPDELIAEPGPHAGITGTATDRAGNSASTTTAPFTIQAGTPRITASSSPAPNANGWNNTAVTVHFTCTEDDRPLAGCPDDVVVSTDGANQTVKGTVTDGAGQTASALIKVHIDRTGPALTFTRSNDETVFVSTLAITGSAADALSGIAGVSCNGTPATTSGSQFQCQATLAPGANSIPAVATDAAGNTTSATLSLTYVRMPKVTITSPANLAYFNISPTTVTGTVDDASATVTINSIAAPLAGGRFSIALPLAEGPNIITATATLPSGAVGTDTVEVTLDTTPPHVTITSPVEGFVTTESSISIAGNVNDIVVGTVNDQQAQVTVNGTPAQVANRTFLAATVPLSIGVNNIQAVARDRVGNQATTQISVVRQPATQPQIKTISGNGQAGVIGSPLGAPLVVELSDGLGNAVPSKPVIFKVTQNDGTLVADGDPGIAVVVVSDAQGRAQARWSLGNRAGAGSNVVEAYSVGFQGTAIFAASGTQGAAGKIVVDTGNDQIGAVGQPLPKPFIAVVVDSGNNRLGGVPVTFTVQQGGGSFDGQPTVTVESDSDGRVAATLTLGLQEGSANNLVEATFPFNTGFSAAFTASGRAPGNPAATTITGVVLDNSNLPIPGVTVRAVLTNVVRSNLAAVQAATAVQTDEHGLFTIQQAPVGLIKLMIDGTTAQREGSYPSLEYDLITVAGQRNDVGQPIYLLPLSTANQLCVTATTGGGTLTVPEAPGFSLTFTPGQVTFPGGSKTGCVSVTVVNGDKVPMVPGFGQQPRFIVTIQPAGAIFNPPAAITLPNVDGLQPRAVTEMYSFDHDIGSFVAIGTGIVSDDGQVIRSAPGVGVLKAGWHCGGNPAANGTVADCPACQWCQNNKCVTDPAQDAKRCNDSPPSFSDSGVSISVDASCQGVCKGGSCGKTSDGFNITDIATAVKSALTKVFSGGCIGSGLQTLMQNNLKGSTLVITCNPAAGADTCATVTGVGKNGLIITPSAFQPKCGPLDSSLLHEMVHGPGNDPGFPDTATHNTYDGVPPDPKDKAYGCEKSCFGVGRGTAAACK
jgi:hypothetical protein